MYCPVCIRDDNHLDSFLCVVCQRVESIAPKPGKVSVEQPERLIEIIQNPKTTKRVKEETMSLLIQNFQYLIRKTVNSLYYSYRLGVKYSWDYADFFQDGLLEFMDLVVNDFKIKKEHGDTGLAVFGNYIKVKLYRRLQYMLQEKLKRHYFHGGERLFDFNAFGNDQISMDVWKFGLSSAMEDMKEAIVGNSFDFTEEVVSTINNENLEAILLEMEEICEYLVEKKIIDDRDRQIWQLVYGSGLNVYEIVEKFESKIGTGKISKARILQIARNVNDQMKTEYGRRMMIRASGLEMFPSKKKGR